MRHANFCPRFLSLLLTLLASTICSASNEVTANKSNPTSAVSPKSNPCLDDAKRLCQFQDKGFDFKINACLEKSLSQVSKACLEKATKENPCYQDSIRLCANKNPFSHQGECLRSKYNMLSPVCQKRFAKFAQFMADCENDIKKFCPGSNDGKAISNCLTPRNNSLESKCKAHIQGSACFPDWKHLCQSSKMTAFDCLQGNISKVSKACATDRFRRYGQPIK